MANGWPANFLSRDDAVKTKMGRAKNAKAAKG
jgi:hypothetical protein